MFITFEGIEGCGKSTQAKLLADYLEDKGIDVVLTREPGGTDISEKIRDILLDVENVAMLKETELLLYLASRAQHTGEVILPNLKNGKIVISDRYTDSTLVYQGLVRDINPDFVRQINNFAAFSLKPDITFLIDLNVDHAFERIKQKKRDRIENESPEFHKKIRKAFLKEANEDKKRFVILNGAGTMDEISKKITSFINDYLKDGEI